MRIERAPAPPGPRPWAHSRCRTGSERTVLFAGQYLNGPAYRGFPWSEFEILEAPSSGEFLGLRKTGKPLEIQSTRPPLSLAQARALGILARDYVVLDAEGEAILDDAVLGPEGSGPPP